MNSTLLKVLIVIGLGLFVIWLFRRSQPIATMLCGLGITPVPGEVECDRDGKPTWRPENAPEDTQWNQVTQTWGTQAAQPLGPEIPPGTPTTPTTPTTTQAPRPLGPEIPRTPQPGPGNIYWPSPPILTAAANASSWAITESPPDPDTWLRLSGEIRAIPRGELIDWLQEGSSIWPAEYDNRTQRWFRLTNPIDLLVASPANVGRPLQVARGNQRGLHELSWTAFNPQIPDWHPGALTIQNAPLSWWNSIQARVRMCIMADQAEAYMDDLTVNPVNMRRLELMTPFEWAVDGMNYPQDREPARAGQHLGTEAAFTHGMTIMRSMAMQVVQWLETLVTELDSGQDGLFQRPVSWGTTLQGPVSSPPPLPAGMTNARGVLLVPRGPWRLGLRIWMVEVLSGIYTPVHIWPGTEDQANGWARAMGRLDTLFMRAWGLPYSTVSKALYHVMANNYPTLLQFIGFMEPAVGPDASWTTTIAMRTMLPDIRQGSPS